MLHDLRNRDFVRILGWLRCISRSRGILRSGAAGISPVGCIPPFPFVLLPQATTPTNSSDMASKTPSFFFIFRFPFLSHEMINDDPGRLNQQNMIRLTLLSIKGLKCLWTTIRPTWTRSIIPILNGGQLSVNKKSQPKHDRYPGLAQAALLQLQIIFWHPYKYV